MKRGPKEISLMLSARVESVCEVLLPGGRRINGHWCVGDVMGGEGKSLKVALEGQFVGKWKDWSADEFHGDLLDLWSQTRNVPLPEALREAKGFLNISEPVSAFTEKTYTPPKTEFQEPSPAGQVMNYLTIQRLLNPSIINRFKVKVHIQDREGFIVFPSFNPNGDWVNNSYVGLSRDAKGRKTVFQDKGAAPCLFGWQGLSSGCFAKRKVILCEGQIDCMTWTQWGYDCLSIPNGNGTTWIDYEWENLECFDTFYLAFDSDNKTKDALQKVITRLGKHRCLIVRTPEKDANDCLKAGRTAEDAMRWLEEAKAPSVPDFIPASELRERVMREFYPPPEAQKPLELPLLKGTTKEKSFLIRPGEVTAWTGISSHGKSAFLTHLFTELMSFGEKAMIASLEMKAEKIVRNMGRCLGGKEMMSPEAINCLMDTIGDCLCFCDRIGYISAKELLEMMEFAHARYGVTQFLIDSLMRIDGLEEDYPAQGQFLNTLTCFSKTNNVHIHLVTHPRKTSDDQRPTSNDLKGSSLLRNNADNIIIVSRNIQKERKLAEGEITQEEADAEWDSAVLVEKDREEGQVKSFKYKYLWKINRYTQLKTK